MTNLTNFINNLQDKCSKATPGLRKLSINDELDHYIMQREGDYTLGDFLVITANKNRTHDGDFLASLDPTTVSLLLNVVAIAKENLDKKQGISTQMVQALDALKAHVAKMPN